MAKVVEFIVKKLMDQKENKTKFYVGWSLVIMVIGSVALAWIMGKNMQRDVSKERFKLTKIYKEIKDESYKYDPIKAKKLYLTLCSRCHGVEAKGSSIYPSLVSGDSTNILDKNKMALIVINGLNAKMPAFKRVDHTDLAHVLNYIRVELNNLEEEISHVEVLQAKVQTIERSTPYLDSEL